MNNYCTNCGKKLNEKAIKCDECNTYVIDIKGEKSRKIFLGIVITLLSIIGIIVIISISYLLYYNFLGKTLNNKYLKNEYPEAKYVRNEPCKECNGSCDGGCIDEDKVIGCYKYYYTSNTKIKDPDIIIFSNKDKISIDTYTTIINKYGFNDSREENFDIYLTEKREDLSIEANNIDNLNIEKIYKMVNEIIENYKKDKTRYLSIDIFDNNYQNTIRISNIETESESKFEWEFNHNIELMNPTIEQVKQIYDPNINEVSQEEWNNNND